MVIGDLMLDQSIVGGVTRFTPDAPVPVVRIGEKTCTLGGAANLASKLAAFQMNVFLIGAIGDDQDGAVLRKFLDEQGVRFLPVVYAGNTIVKTVVSGVSSGGERQKLMRLDYEPAAGAIQESSIINRIEEIVQSVDAVVISDYLKGVCSLGVCQMAIAAARAQEIPVIVDPKGADWYRYKGATCVKPNFEELATALGVSEPLERTLEAAIAAGHTLMSRHELGSILISRDASGLLYLGPTETINLPAEAQQVVDVVGAGDAVVAAFTASRVSGLPIDESVQIANLAGALAVERRGAAPISSQELELRFRGAHDSKTIVAGALPSLMGSLRAAGKKVVFTNGCFDMIHRGHIHHLREARLAGDVLIVGLNSDESVTRVKGQGRPILGIEDRLSVLTSLPFVDYVVVFEEDTPLEILKVILPDLLVKGANTEQIIGEAFARAVLRLPMLSDRPDRKTAHGLRVAVSRVLASEERPAEFHAQDEGHAVPTTKDGLVVKQRGVD